MHIIISISLLFILFFSGCQSYYTQRKPSFHAEKVLQATRTGDIIHTNSVKALISATYMNMLQPESYRGEEYFLVGLYISDDMPAPETRGIYNPQFTLKTQSGNTYKTLRPLLKDDPLFQQVPTLNRWKHYYLISFAKEEGHTISLVYSHKLYGETLLEFKRY